MTEVRVHRGLTERPSNVPPASHLEQLVFVFFSFWVLVGLCLDGWAHRHQPDLESFFTPWHAVFYSGYIGGVAWLGFIVARRRPFAPSLRSAIPDGFQLAVVGLGVFAVGAVGDGIWHTYFGVETALDALLSPTHLALLVGMLASATSPIRALWRKGSEGVEDPSYVAFLPVTLSLTTSTVGIAFFFLYANGLNNWPMTRGYRPGLDEPLAALGILGTLTTTILLLFPVMLILRRWKPPFGTFLTLFGFVGLFMAGLDAFESPWQILAPVVGGLTADGLIATTFSRAESERTDRATASRRCAVLCGLAVPLIMWSVATLALHLAWGIDWPPELWVGAIVMASLVGLGLATVSHPPPIPDSD